LPTNQLTVTKWRCHGFATAVLQNVTLACLAIRAAPRHALSMPYKPCQQSELLMTRRSRLKARLSRFALPSGPGLAGAALAGATFGQALLPMAALAQQAPTPAPAPVTVLSQDAVPTPAEATAPAPAPAVDAEEDDSGSVLKGREIIVRASRLKGQVLVAQQPIVTFTAQDIAAYGVSSIADLLTAIAPETNSGRGRGATMPVILVNGQRIASFRELRDYPPEAIRKVEVLPEEVALRYGYPPDQRVVNFILKNHYHSRTLEVEGSEPDRGGADTEKAQLQYLRVNKDNRLNFALEADRTSALSEAARDVAQSPASLSGLASDPNPADNRSLVAASRNYSANINWTQPLGHGSAPGNLTINAALSRADTTSLVGLNSVDLVGPAPAALSLERTLPGALTRFNRTDTLQSGATLNKPLGQWQFTATLDGTHTYAITDSDNRADTSALLSAAAAGTLAIDGVLPVLPSAGFVHAETDSNSLTSLLTLIGHPATLPAGQTALTIKAGFAWSGQTGSIAQSGGAQSGGGSAGVVPSLKRGDASVGIDLALPLTSRKEQFGAGLGDITLDLSLGGDQLSDFGWLTNWSAGLNWDVTPRLSLEGTAITKQAAPSFGDLGYPTVLNFNEPVFDFTTGQTELVTVITGGNRALRRESEHDIKLGLNWTLPFLQRSNLIVEYFDNHSDNVSAPFPLLTPAIEAAFPGRVTRVGGVITSINEQPVTLSNQHEARLRWGFNLFGTIGKPTPFNAGRFGALYGGAGRNGGNRGGPAGGGAAFGHAGGGFSREPGYPGRWNLAIYHTVQFIDRVLVAPGGPSLDLLNGDALGDSGGVARQSVEVDGGLFYKGLGLRLSGTWTGPTHVNASGAPASSDLRYGALAKFNLRGFIDFDQRPDLVQAVPFLKRARLTLRVNNVLDSRQRVTDGTGATPVAYQSAIMDPLGRVIGAELRKMF